MNCSRCGAALQPGWVACPKCGLAFDSSVLNRQPGAVAGAALSGIDASKVFGPPTESQNYSNCPTCGESLMPLSEYVRQHTQIIMSPSGKQSVVQSADVARLSLPAAPRVTSGGGSGVGNCLLVVLTAGIWLIVVGVMAILNVAASGTSMVIWTKASNVWKRLLYSPSCAKAYDPENKQTILSADVRRYIYRPQITQSPQLQKGEASPTWWDDMTSVFASQTKLPKGLFYWGIPFVGVLVFGGIMSAGDSSTSKQGAMAQMTNAPSNKPTATKTVPTVAQSRSRSVVEDQREQVHAYMIVVGIPMQVFESATKDMQTLNSRYQPYSPKWNAALQRDSTSLIEVHDQVAAITPPDVLRNEHAELLQSMEDYKEAGAILPDAAQHRSNTQETVYAFSLMLKGADHLGKAYTELDRVGHKYGYLKAGQ